MNTVNKKEAAKDLILLILGAVIYSVGTKCFIVPANIAPGGAVGIALMANFLTGLPVGSLTLLVNLPLLVLAWLYLSRKFAIRTAFACGICTVRKVEFSRLKRIIHEVDETAFVMVTETTEVFGLGFKNISTDAVS